MTPLLEPLHSYAYEDLNVLPEWHVYPSVRIELIQSQMQIVGEDDSPAIVRQTVLYAFWNLAVAQ